MSGTSAAISIALIHSVWQIAIVALLLRVVLALLRRRGAQVRYAIACAGLAAMVAMPVITVATVYTDAPAPPPTEAEVAVVLSEVTARPAPRDALNAPSDPRASAEWMQRLQPWVLPVWITGVMAFSLRLAAAGAQVRSARRRAVSADEDTCALVERLASRIGLSRQITAVFGTAEGGFMTYGWLKPVIMLPPAATLGLSVQQLETLLAHELAHIRRHDFLVNVIQMTVETLLFYHPAVWWASSRIRAERELCCDDIVLATGGDPSGYARALTAVAHGQLTAMPLGASSGPLVQRIQRILSQRPAARGGAWAVPALVLTIAGVTVGLVQAQELMDARTIVRGQVTELGTGQPLAGVTVRAFHVTGIPVPNRPRSPIGDGDQIGPKGAHPVYYATTDASGRYEIRGLRPGEYLVAGGGRGFVTAHFGQEGDNTPEATVVVASAVSADHIDFEVARAGRISGTIRDEHGREVNGVEVSLIRRQYFPGGARPTSVIFALSEDGGAFDLQEIPPGDYYIYAAPAEGVHPTGDDPRAIYAAAYFPAAPDIGAAQLIGIGSGQILSGFDIVLGVTHTQSIAGRVIDPQRRPLAEVRVQLVPWSADGLTNRRAPVDQEGRFHIDGVAPGKFIVMVSDSVEDRRWSPQEIIVGNAPVDLEFVATAGISARGRIVADGRTIMPFDPTELMVSLEPEAQPDGMQLASGLATIAADGSFTLTGSPGTTTLQVRRVPRGWLLKSVSLDEIEVTDTAFTLAAGFGAHLIDVVLTDRGGHLAGRVSDRMGRPAPNALIVIFPADRHRWTSPRLMQTTFSHQQGRFDFGTIAAGAYRVVAVPGLPRNAWTDPAVLERLWSDSTDISLQEGQRRVVDVKMALPPNDLFQ
jgi:beta-lactamase regulating signal transducer with metallopeptidase domain/protocatechuate 3,4-dioxygenase beta subunit